MKNKFFFFPLVVLPKYDTDFSYEFIKKDEFLRYLKLWHLWYCFYVNKDKKLSLCINLSNKKRSIFRYFLNLQQMNYSALNEVNDNLLKVSLLF